MNAKELKEIIKECVREVLREELTNIGKNYVVENYTPKPNINNIYNPPPTSMYHKPPLPQITSFPLTNDNPKSSIEKILEQTAREASMDPSKLSNYV